MKKLVTLSFILLLTMISTSCNDAYAIKEKQLQEQQKQEQEAVKKLLASHHQEIIKFLEENPNPLPEGQTKEEGFKKYTDFILIYYTSAPYNGMNKEEILTVIKKAEKTLDIKKQ